MTTLVESVQKHVEDQIAELEGEDDFMPFMVYEGRLGRGIVGLDMPAEMDDRATTADVMASMLAVNRATEAVFASCAWAVVAVPGGRDISGIRPSQDPLRIEIAFLAQIGPENAMHQARVYRENGRVRLGDWTVQSGADTTLGGQFGDAMRQGMELGSRLSDETFAFLDEAIEKDGMERAIAPIMRAFAQRREMSG